MWTQPKSPLKYTFERLHDLDDSYSATARLTGDCTPYWLSADRLAGPDPAELAEGDTGGAHWQRYLDAILASFAAAHPARGQQAHGARWWVGYLDAVLGVTFACYLLDQRVPDLDPKEVLVYSDDQKGQVTDLVWSGYFTALASDPAAGDEFCTVVATEEDLRSVLRLSLTDHLATVIAALARYTTFGKPGMWALAADYVAKTMLEVGEQLGMVDQVIAEARILNAPWSLLHRQRDFIAIPHAGGTDYLVDRTACCQKHKLVGKTNCKSCPQRPLAERIELARRKRDRQVGSQGLTR